MEISQSIAEQAEDAEFVQRQACVVEEIEQWIFEQDRDDN